MGGVDSGRVISFESGCWRISHTLPTCRHAKNEYADLNHAENEYLLHALQCIYFTHCSACSNVTQLMHTLCVRVHLLHYASQQLDCTNSREGE